MFFLNQNLFSKRGGHDTVLNVLLLVTVTPFHRNVKGVMLFFSLPPNLIQFCSTESFLNPLELEAKVLSTAWKPEKHLKPHTKRRERETHTSMSRFNRLFCFFPPLFMCPPVFFSPSSSFDPLSSSDEESDPSFTQRKTFSQNVPLIPASPTIISSLSITAAFTRSIESFESQNSLITQSYCRERSSS